jgi:CRP-like cAMP-binding protein
MLNFQQKEEKMKKYLKILQKCPLFAGIEEEHLLRMLECRGAKVLTFDKKYTILMEGNPAKYIGIVLSGSAQIIRTDFYGNRSIIAEVRPSELFGEDFACAEMGELPISVIANEPCEIMLLECANVLHTCQNNCGFHQRLIFNLMKGLAVKTLIYHRKVAIVSHRNTRDKLLAYLDLAAQEAGSNRFTIPFDRQALADYLEVDRSGLSSEIGKLRAEGLLQSRKNEFELLQ